MEYHEEMYTEIYEQWFKHMLQSLEDPSIILMDNIRCVTTLIKLTKWKKKPEIIDCLHRHGENVHSSMLKLQLLFDYR